MAITRKTKEQEQVAEHVDSGRHRVYLSSDRLVRLYAPANICHVRLPNRGALWGWIWLLGDRNTMVVAWAITTNNNTHQEMGDSSH